MWPDFGVQKKLIACLFRPGLIYSPGAFAIDDVIGFIMSTCLVLRLG